MSRAAARPYLGQPLLGAFEPFHFAGHAATGTAFADALAEAARDAGWSMPTDGPRIGGLPWPLMRAAAPLVPMWRELVQMRYLWTTPHRLDGARIERFAGPVPATPLRQALAESLASLGLVRMRRPTFAGV